MGGQQSNHISTGKKSRLTIRQPNGATFMLRCASLGLSSEALNSMTIGMVYDMLIEQGNDQHEYPIKATQADIEAFFGKG